MLARDVFSVRDDVLVQGKHGLRELGRRFRVVTDLGRDLLHLVERAVDQKLLIFHRVGDEELRNLADEEENYEQDTERSKLQKHGIQTAHRSSAMRACHVLSPTTPSGKSAGVVS